MPAYDLDVTYLLADTGPTLENSPLFESQVLDWIAVQRESGIRVGLVTAVADLPAFAANIQPRLDGLGMPLTLFPQSGPLTIVVRAALALRRFLRSHRTRNVYVRGLWAAHAHWLAYPFQRPRLIYDFRGDVVRELSYVRRRRLRQWLVARLASRAIRHANVATCVSNPAARLLSTAYGKPGATVMPSCVDTTRFAIDPTEAARLRASLGFGPDDIVLVYAGGLSRYQMIPEMLRLWHALQDDPTVKFLMLTNQTPTPIATPIDVSSLPTDRLQWTTASRADIPRYLASADIGFLLREDHPVNRVASPVKLGEYLASGLAVVTSPGVGDASDIVMTHRVGAVISPQDAAAGAETCRILIQGVRAGRDAWRARSVQTAHELLDWRVHLPAWHKLLGIDAPAPAHAATGAVG